MKLGFIGLGAVGSRLSTGACREGHAEVYGFDLRINSEEFKNTEEYCVDSGVKLTTNIQELVEKSDVLISATTCNVAVATAESVCPFMSPKKYYIDINSAVPEVKKEIQSLIENTGADFCDGGIMGAPVELEHRVPIVLSGKKAQEVAAILNGYKLNIRAIGTEVGMASSLKILRSIFTKGIEALLIEAYSAAYHYGVLDEVKASVFQFLKKDTLESMFESVLCTDVVHAERRAQEIGAVSDMLDKINFNSIMSKAAYDKLMWAANSGVKTHFNGMDAEDYMDVVKYYSKITDDK